MALAVHHTGEFQIRVADLTSGWPIRASGVDRLHVATLAELRGAWAPIVVWGHRNVLVDGAHRVAAARQLGMDSLNAYRFVGDEDAAYVYAVECNVRHGLPLTMDDRTRAVSRMLDRYPEWSDRRIAAVCAVSVTTVGKTRGGCQPAPSGEGSRRLGRDGKWRPVRPAPVRERIVQELEADGSRSLRAIAAAVGVSPETVRTVRRSLMSAPPAPPPGHRAVPADEANPVAALRLVGDAAVVSRAGGDRFAEWFDAVDYADDWQCYVEGVPQSRIYEVADEARRRAAKWTDFARALERNVSRPAALKA